MSDVTLWLDQAVGHHVEGDLTRAEAEAVTVKIKSYSGVAWVLLSEAHQRKAHKALGYSSWGEYVEAEFDMSKSRSYQLINQANVIEVIGREVSTMVDISERDARDLAPVLEDAVIAAQQAKDEAERDGADDAETERRIHAALSGVRSAQQEKHKASYVGTQTTTTETTVKQFDPETGEIIEGGGEASPATTPPPSNPAEEGGDAGSEGTTAAPPSSKGLPVDPDLSYRAQFSRELSHTYDGLFTFDPERVADTAADLSEIAAYADDLAAYAQRLHQAVADRRKIRSVS